MNKITLLTLLSFFVSTNSIFSQSIAFGGSLGVLLPPKKGNIDERYISSYFTHSAGFRAQFVPKNRLLNREVTITGELVQINSHFDFVDIRPRGGPVPFSEIDYTTKLLDLRLTILLDLIKSIKAENLAGGFRSRVGIVALTPFSDVDMFLDFTTPQSRPEKIDYFSLKSIGKGFKIEPGLTFELSHESPIKDFKHSLTIGLNLYYFPINRQSYEITIDHEDNLSSRIVKLSRNGANIYILFGLTRRKTTS